MHDHQAINSCSFLSKSFVACAKLTLDIRSLIIIIVTVKEVINLMSSVNHETVDRVN